MKGYNNVHNYHKQNNSYIKKKNDDFNTITHNNERQNYNIIKEIETYPLEIFINLLNNTMKKTKTTIKKSINPKRKIAIEKLIKTKKSFNISNKIIHLSIFLMDIILEKTKIYSKTEQILLVCLILSIKFLHNQTELPYFHEIQLQWKNTYLSFENIKILELFCLEKVNYDLNIVTPVDFLEYFECKGLIFIDDIKDNNRNYINQRIIHSKLNEYLAKIMSKVSYLSIDPLEIACVCICLTRESFNIKEKWHKFMSDCYNINFYDFENTYIKVKEIISDNYKRVELNILNNNNYGHSYLNNINNINNTNNNFNNVNNTNNNINNINKGYPCFRDNSNLKKFISGKFITSNAMKKIKRNFSLELNKNTTSTLNNYVKSNINEFNNKERKKHHLNKSINSNDSNCKKDTGVSSTCTPETISKKSIPKIKGFKIKRFKEQHSSLIIDSIQKFSSRSRINKLYEVRNNSYRKNRKNNSLNNKNNGSYIEENEKGIHINYNYIRNNNTSAKKCRINSSVSKR